MDNNIKGRIAWATLTLTQTVTVKSIFVVGASPTQVSVAIDILWNTVS